MRSSWLWTLAALLALAGASYAVFVATRVPPLPQGVIYGNGHIEGTEIRVAAEVAGKVVEQHMTEGVRVTAGATLAVIEPQTNRDRLQMAGSAIAAREETRAGLDAQISTW
ncbi:MAG: biotin/lipoyl-binding protein, partial [Gammaproteobacteria bacterium]|nr:biotin/lipoyl-binding protein [Gammaproteobacteria bacterium]